MKTITQYRQEIDNLMQQLGDMKARCISENREPSGDERRKADGLLNRVVELEDIIALEMRTQETQDRLSEPLRAPMKPNPGGGPDAQAKKDSFLTFGEQMQAVMQAGMPDSRGVDPRLRTSMRNAASGLQEAIPSDGGFVIQPEFSQELLKRTYETGQVSSRCRRIPVGTNSNTLKINGVDETSRVAGSRWGGVQAYWEGEADKYTGKKPKFRQIELNLKKLTGLCYATDEMLNDAIALQAIIEQAFSEEFGFQMDDGAIWGTGAGMPLGIMNGPCLVTVNKEAGQLAKTVQSENIVNMYARCWAKGRTNAVWFINQDVEPQLFTMGITVGTGGSPIYMPPGGLSSAPYATLLGRPVIAIEQCQTLGTLGDIIFGDFSQYIIIDKGAMESASSIHVRFEYGEQVFRFTYRADGQPIWNSALTPYKGSNTLSPFVTLQART